MLTKNLSFVINVLSKYIPYLCLNQCLLGSHSIGEDSMNAVLFIFLFFCLLCLCFLCLSLLFTSVICTIGFVLHRSDLLGLILSCLSLSTSMPQALLKPLSTILFLSFHFITEVVTPLPVATTVWSLKP